MDNFITSKKRVRQVNAVAPILKSKFSVVPLDSILDIHAFDINKALKVDPLLIEPEEVDHVHTGPDCKHESHYAHDNAIHTLWFKCERETTLEQLNQWFAQILWENLAKCDKIFRIKGIAAIKMSPIKYMVQGVHENFEVVPSEYSWDSTEQRMNKFVFIGKGINIDNLKQTFQDVCCTEH